MNDQEKKQLYYEEIKDTTLELHHIMDMEGITDQTLIDIDHAYGVTNALSVKNANKYRDVILWLSVLGGIITLSFLFYDEGEFHGLIISCTVFLIIFYLIKRKSDNLEYHRKYLEYRVLAETLRVQFFLTFADIRETANEMLPWFIKVGIPWIGEVLSEMPLKSTGIKRPILNYWIINQRDYHNKVLNRDKPKYKKQEFIQMVSLIITIVVYIITLVVEFLVFTNFIPADHSELMRTLLKIVIGTAAVFALFATNYYGKMSLDDNIHDSERMIALYNEVESQIKANDGIESEEIVKYLAKEFLIENSTWYAYQNQNRPDWVM